MKGSAVWLLLSLFCCSHALLWRVFLFLNAMALIS
nr:MAG TPA: hypothetical protein [Caudoviricetes sp.]